MPKRFCNNRETSELFRLGSIILYLRLHRTYSGYVLHSQRAGANLRSTLHLGIDTRLVALERAAVVLDESDKLRRPRLRRFKWDVIAARQVLISAWRVP
jgi:hypothetical protein